MDNQLLWHDFYQEINQPDQQIDLAKASLYYAKAEYPDLDVQKYLDFLKAIATAIKSQLTTAAYPLKVIQAINFELFDGLGFQGNNKDYYNPDNSFLNQVIERRVGIPISLSVIYLSVAQRMDFPMVGIGMPGHFLIRPNFDDVGVFVDAFNRGEILFKQDCQKKLSRMYQQPVELNPNWLAPVSNKQILARMLNNLKFIYLHQREINKALSTMSGIIQLFPHNAPEIRDRGLLYYQTNRWQEAAVDLEYFLKIAPHNEDTETIKLLLDKINQVF
jgi:regulator of sirC expression with transglutaminase-like and TPR domain